MDKFKEVSKDEYYASFMKKDAVVHTDTSNGYPYTSIWSLRGSQTIIAKRVPVSEKTEYPVRYKYLIRI